MKFPIPPVAGCKTAMRLVDILVASHLALRDSGDAVIEQTRRSMEQITDDPKAFGIEFPRFPISYLNEGPEYCQGDPAWDLVANWVETARAAMGDRPASLPGPKWAWDVEELPKKAAEKLIDLGRGAFPWLTVIAVVALIVGLAYAWRTFIGRAA